MWVRVKGLKIVTNGKGVYAYHRGTGKRLKNSPVRIGRSWMATPELVAEIAAVEKLPTTLRPGSVAALFASYRKSEAFTNLAKRTQDDYIKVIVWMRDRAGETTPDGLSTVRARQVRDFATRQKGYRFGKYVVQVMRVVWQHGVDYGLAPDNPWKAVSLPKRPKGLSEANRPWTRDEVKSVFALAAPGLARAFTLALLGFRPSEIPAMTWRALTPDGIANISQKTKFATTQRVPPSLAAYLAGNRPALTIATNTRGRPFKSENALSKASGDFLRTLAEKGATAPGLTIKGLNHTLGSALAERGVDIRTAKDAMQKRSLQTTLHYSRRADTRRNAHQAIGELENWLAVENSEPQDGKRDNAQAENS